MCVSFMLYESNDQTKRGLTQNKLYRVGHFNRPRWISQKLREIQKKVLYKSCFFMTKKVELIDFVYGASSRSSQNQYEFFK